jgi:hypothetical protein
MGETRVPPTFAGSGVELAVMIELEIPRFGPRLNQVAELC